MGKAKVDLVGMRFGRWLVVSHERDAAPHRYWKCRCDCGKEAVLQGNSLRTGQSKSCGCLRREVSKAKATTHNQTNTPGYYSWQAMIGRCMNPTHVAYKNYGARGISVCEKWQKFQGFWEDMGASWAEGVTIDRIDVNGNYEPSNCRWATKAEQGSNKRNNVMMYTPWGLLHQAEAARRAGIGLGTLINRMKSGWPQSKWFDPPRE